LTVELPVTVVWDVDTYISFTFIVGLHSVNP